MQEERPSINAAQVLAWISVLLAFGVAQGVIYLRAFWGRFGLDPFQFSNASDLAIVGLTGIGVTVAFMAGAALLGGYLGNALAQHHPKSKLTMSAIVLVFLGGLVALAFFIDLGIYLLIGMVLTWIIVWLIRRSPDIPAHFKKVKLVAYIAVAIAYVPMASHYYGQRKANNVFNSEKALHLSIEQSVGTGLPSGEQRFAGRLGGEYIFYSPAHQSISIVQADAAQKITLTKAEKGTGQINLR
jgi:hypothetical protein